MIHKNAAPSGVYQDNKADFAISNKTESASSIQLTSKKKEKKEKVVSEAVVEEVTAEEAISEVVVSEEAASEHQEVAVEVVETSTEV